MAFSTQKIVSIAAFVLSLLFLLIAYERSDRQPKARYIFVDLGANRGDSLEVFLQHENAKFEYDYPRPTWATHEQAGESLDGAFC